MAEGTGYTEGENRPVSKWQRLKELGKRVLHRNTTQVDEASVKKLETAVIPADSGYAALIANIKKEFGNNGDHLAATLNNEYASLISVVDSDTRLSEETRQALKGGISNGDVQAIAIVTERLLERVKQESGRSAKPVNKDRLIKLAFLAGKTREKFITVQANRDDSQRPLSVKQHNARLEYFNAVKHSVWKPIEQVPLGIRNSFKDFVSDAGQTTATPPPPQRLSQ